VAVEVAFLTRLVVGLPSPASLPAPTARRLREGIFQGMPGLSAEL